MKQKIFLILPLLSLLFAQNASAFCDSVATKVYITMNPGNVKYITTRSKHDFIHSTNNPGSPNTLGLTVSHMNVSIDNIRPKLETEN